MRYCGYSGYSGGKTGRRPCREKRNASSRARKAKVADYVAVPRRGKRQRQERRCKCWKVVSIARAGRPSEHSAPVSAAVSEGADLSAFIAVRSPGRAPRSVVEHTQSATAASSVLANFA